MILIYLMKKLGMTALADVTGEGELHQHDSDSEDK